MKRDEPENGVEDEDCSKRCKLEFLGAHAEAFEEVQRDLQKLDEDCAREQMLIQKTYDEEKKPLFEKRQAIIDKIPEFWCRTFCNHHAFETMTDEDIEIMRHLKRVDLDDNLDDNGSYKLCFHFDEKAKEFFEPLTLVKHVKFENNKEIVVDVTEIEWKEGKSPIDAARAKPPPGEWDEEASIFEWFSKETPDNRPDLGEAIRREIWHSPLMYFRMPAPPAGGVYDDTAIDEGEEEEQDADDADGNEEAE